MNMDKRSILENMAAEGRRSLCPPETVRINIGTSSCGLARGAGLLYDKLAARRDWPVPVQVVAVGCLGACFAEPLIQVRLPGGHHYFFGRVDSKSLWHVIRLVEGQPPTSYLWLTAVEKEPGQLRGLSDLQFTGDLNSSLGRFLRPQVRSLSDSWGLINPRSIAEYAATGGYFALKDVLNRFPPRQVREWLITSGVLDGGGKQHLGRSPLMVGSTNEFTPLELALVENNPHHLLESLLLTGYALGISEAVILIPGRYPLAADLMARALAEARQYGLVGRDILGTRFSLEISVVDAQAFPTLDTKAFGWSSLGLPRLAQVPGLVRRAARNEKLERQTMIFHLTGDVKNHGFVEVPRETDLPGLVRHLTGKSPDSFKALVIDHPHGTFIPFNHKGLPSVPSPSFLFDELAVLDHHRCLVEKSLAAVSAPSLRACPGKAACTAGRSLLQTRLTLLTKGQGGANTLQEIEAVARQMTRESHCPEGCPPAELVLSGLQLFREEFAAHAQGYCPTLACKDLIRFEILQGKCKGCRCCYLVCPTGAVIHRKGDKRFFVDDSLCIKCGSCAKTCPFGCIRPVSEAL